jgi:hypothetical protein
MPRRFNAPKVFTVPHRTEERRMSTPFRKLDWPPLYRGEPDCVPVRQLTLGYTTKAELYVKDPQGNVYAVLEGMAPEMWAAWKRLQSPAPARFQRVEPFDAPAHTSLLKSMPKPCAKCGGVLVVDIAKSMMIATCQACGTEFLAMTVFQADDTPAVETRRMTLEELAQATAASEEEEHGEDDTDAEGDDEDDEE